MFLERSHVWGEFNSSLFVFASIIYLTQKQDDRYEELPRNTAQVSPACFCSIDFGGAGRHKEIYINEEYLFFMCSKNEPGANREKSFLIISVSQ